MKRIKPLLAAAIVSTLILSGCSKSNDAVTTPPAPVVNYTNVKITTVVATNLPMTKSNGGGWQNNSGPNVYFKILDPNNTVLFTGSTVSNVTTASLPLSWNFTQAFQITNLNTIYTIMFYNHNAILTDDQMGGYYFTMADYKTGYPTIVPISSTQSQVALKFSTTWY